MSFYSFPGVLPTVFRCIWGLWHIDIFEPFHPTCLPRFLSCDPDLVALRIIFLMLPLTNCSFGWTFGEEVFDWILVWGIITESVDVATQSFLNSPTSPRSNRDLFEIFSVILDSLLHFCNFRLFNGLFYFGCLFIFRWINLILMRSLII